MKAEYVDHMGDDLRVVNAARVSFDKESYLTDDERIQERDKKLINYLATHGHWTPFAHPMITMRETVPIFVARQRFKHMVGFTYNEVSRRYVDDTPEFFTPAVWHSRPDGSVKQGSGGEHPASDHWRAQYISLKEHVLDLYHAMIEEGVAPEQARMCMPQSMYTSYYVTGSLAAWARAYKQRSDAHAQQEIQELAKDWDDVLRWHFPVCWEALVGG